VSMESMRRGLKKHRTVVIIIIAILIVGLVSSFAFMGAGGNKFNSATQGDNVEQVQAQIDSLEKYIAEFEPEGEELTFSENKLLADNYLSLMGLYLQINETSKLNEHMEEGVKYYKAALDTAPKDLNDLGKAQIYSSIGLMQFYNSQTSEAKANFKKALRLAETDLDINNQYAFVLYYVDGIEAVVNHLNGLKKLLSDENELAAVDSMISYYQEADAAATANQENNSDDSLEK
jgi:tetratricopeptide (TPR) repeat protein